MRGEGKERDRGVPLFCKAQDSKRRAQQQNLRSKAKEGYTARVAEGETQRKRIERKKKHIQELSSDECCYEVWEQPTFELHFAHHRKDDEHKRTNADTKPAS